MSELNPDVNDVAPTSETITPYDEQHFITYTRLLDAEAQGADWREVTQIVLHRDTAAYPERSFQCWASHVRRARWMVEHGYTQLMAVR